MATHAAKAKPRSSSSCTSFLKDALLLPTLNPKLFIPVLVLVTFSNLLVQATNVLAIQPLTVHMLDLLNKINNMDPSTAEYAKLLEEIMRDARELVGVVIVSCITVLVLSFAKQLVALFAASTTYSGERYSLAELISKVIAKGGRVKGPLVTMALVCLLEFTFMFLLAALLQLAIRHPGAFAVYGLLFIAFLYLNVVLAVAVAVSVADTDRRGVAAVQQAWRLMTRVRPKEGCVLVIVTELLSMASSPLYLVALEFVKRSALIRIALLFVSALLSGVVQLFCFGAAMVYYYQAVERKQAIADDDYVKIPAGEATCDNFVIAWWLALIQLFCYVIMLGSENIKFVKRNMITISSF